MKKIFIFGMIAAFVLGFSPMAFSADVAKIGVISFEKILKESSSGKMNQKELSLKGEELKDRLRKEKTDIDALSKAFEREALVLSPEKQDEKKRNLRIRYNDFQKMQEDFSKQMKGMEIKLISQIQKDVFEIANKLGKEEGYLLIIERKTAGVIYIPEKVDITDAVIALYNAKVAKTN